MRGSSPRHWQFQCATSICLRHFRAAGARLVVSENRRAVSWKQAAIGLALTFVTALVLLKVPQVVSRVRDHQSAPSMPIAAATRAGTSFVFGYLGGGTLPYDLKIPGAEFVLALQALPIVLVMSVLTTLLFYWRILPPIVRGFAWAARTHARGRRRGRARRPPPTSFSAWSRRRCSSGPTSRA